MTTTYLGTDGIWNEAIAPIFTPLCFLICKVIFWESLGAKNNNKTALQNIFSWGGDRDTIITEELIIKWYTLLHGLPVL